MFWGGGKKDETKVKGQGQSAPRSFISFESLYFLRLISDIPAPVSAQVLLLISKQRSRLCSSCRSPNESSYVGMNARVKRRSVCERVLVLVVVRRRRLASIVTWECSPCSAQHDVRTPQVQPKCVYNSLNAIYVYMYIFIHIYIFVHMYIYIYYTKCATSLLETFTCNIRATCDTCVPSFARPSTHHGLF